MSINSMTNVQNILKHSFNVITEENLLHISHIFNMCRKNNSLSNPLEFLTQCAIYIPFPYSYTCVCIGDMQKFPSHSDLIL